MRSLSEDGKVGPIGLARAVGFASI
jgi:uncharacterized membrane protein